MDKTIAQLESLDSLETFDELDYSQTMNDLPHLDSLPTFFYRQHSYWSLPMKENNMLTPEEKITNVATAFSNEKKLRLKHTLVMINSFRKKHTF